jgi:uncharacterized membrane protein YphA (DoxX/SURF4 family)
MTTDKAEHGVDVRAWASLVVRLAIAALFCAAAVSKFKGGMTSIRGTISFFQSTFETTWLPGWMVTMHAYATLVIEPLIVIWLVTGFRLRIGWIVTCLFMISLAFGMAVAGKHDSAASNFNYVLICCVGLYLSQYDRFSLDRPTRGSGPSGR